MKTVLKFFFVLVLASIAILAFRVNSAYAITPSLSPEDPDENVDAITITFSDLVAGNEYRICLTGDCIARGAVSGSGLVKIPAESDNTLSITVCGEEDALRHGACNPGDFFEAHRTYRLGLFPPGSESTDPLIPVVKFNVDHVYPNEPVCSPTNPVTGEPITITLSGNRRPKTDGSRNKIDIDSFRLGGGANPTDPDDQTILPDESITFDWPKPENGNNGVEGGYYRINLRWDHEDFVLYQINLTVESGGGECIVTKMAGGGGGTDDTPTEYDPAPGNPDEFVTPLGTITTDPQGLATAVLNFGIGTAGGIAFLIMVFGAYRLMFSAGNPEAVQQGREIITAAISGLLVIIFAVFILGFLGFTLFGLNIPTP